MSCIRASNSACPSEISNPIAIAQSGNSRTRSTPIFTKSFCVQTTASTARLDAQVAERVEIGPFVGVVVRELAKRRSVEAAFERVSAEKRPDCRCHRRQRPCDRRVRRSLLVCRLPTGVRAARGCTRSKVRRARGGGQLIESGFAHPHRSNWLATMRRHQPAAGSTAAREAFLAERGDRSRMAPTHPTARCRGRGESADVGRRRPAESTGSCALQSPPGPPPRGPGSAHAVRRAVSRPAQASSLLDPAFAPYPRLTMATRTPR